MSEKFERRDLSIEEISNVILNQIDIKDKIISFVCILITLLCKYLILFLDFTSNKLKFVLNQDQHYNDIGTQTVDSQHLMDLVTHHFGALHEENYIKKIIYKSQWNKMNSELIFIKEQIRCQNDCLNLFKEEIKELNVTLKSFKDLMVFSNSQKPHLPYNVNVTSSIPPPPPLPPPGFISSNLDSVFRPGQISRKKMIFEENSSLRPLITVESLKEVKLKKIPSPRKLQDEEKDELNDRFPGNFKNLRKVMPDAVRKRPKTADCSKIKPKTNMTISPPRPLTSEN